MQFEIFLFKHASLSCTFIAALLAEGEITINPINNVLKFGRYVARRLVCTCDVGLRVMTYSDGTMVSWLAGSAFS